MLFRTPGKKLEISWTLLKTVSFLFFLNFRRNVFFACYLLLLLSNKITLSRAISSSSDESIFQMNDKLFLALMISSVNVHTCFRSF